MSKKYRKNRRDDQISIPEYFSGKSVFITGGTGFMGKILIEKLLRSCPQIDKIYVLMRPKKGKSAQERLNDLLALEAFVKVRRIDLTLLDKVVAVTGDVCEKRLGLSEEERKMLIRNVSIIFHAAASVRFDDPLKEAIIMNSRGTLEALLLASEMKLLDCFTYVSTVYCNTHVREVEEMVYPLPLDWKMLIKTAENFESHELEIYAKKILGNFPNTYTFTKNVAEQICVHFQDKIPIVIFRPSIVIASVLEPLPGWVDNFNGPVGLLIGSGKGIVRTVYGNPKKSSDYIPVDLAIKSLIVASWYRAIDQSPCKTLTVYNASSYAIKNVTQEQVEMIAHYATNQVPLNDMIWYPTGSTTQCKFVYYINVFFLHIIPALLLDGILKLRKKKGMLLKLQRKIFHANWALEYFLFRQWVFKNQRMFSLVDEILEEDVEDFYFKVLDLDETDYFITASYGARQYLLHEDNTGLPEAKKRLKKMYWVHKVTNFMVLMLMMYVAVKLNVIPMIRNCLLMTLNYFVKIFEI